MRTISLLAVLLVLLLSPGCALFQGTPSGTTIALSKAERITLKIQGAAQAVRADWYSRWTKATNDVIEAQQLHDAAALADANRRQAEAARNLTKLDKYLTYINDAVLAIKAAEGDPTAQGAVLQKLGSQLTDDPMLQTLIVLLPDLIQELQTQTTAAHLASPSKTK